MSITPVSVANVAIRMTSLSCMVVLPVCVTSLSVTQTILIMPMVHRNAGATTEGHEEISQHAFVNLACVMILYLTNVMTIDS